MHTIADLKDLKRSALDLLMSGNSVEAVADMLRIPIDQVTAWQRQGSPAVVGDPSAADASGPVDGVPIHSMREVHPGPTGFVPQRPVTRSILILLPLVLGTLTLVSDLHATLMQLDLLWLYWLGLLAGLALGMSSIAYGVRSGFELAARGIVFRNAVGSRELAYADIESYRLTRNPQLGVYVLDFAVKRGASGMSIWLESAQVQGDIARWCASMRCTGYVSTYHGGGPDSVEREWNDLLRQG
jgi:hypothetical protein